MSEQNKIIGKRIKNRRKELGMTQKDLAQRIGCAEITIRQYESGRNAPKIDTRISIAKALDIPYGTLFNPDNSELMSMLPEMGGSIENDPNPEKTQANFDRASIEDLSSDLTKVLEKSGLVTHVPDQTNPFYLHGVDRKAVKLNDNAYSGYLKRQLANITNYHNDYVGILRSVEETTKNNDVTLGDDESSPDDNRE